MGRIRVPGRPLALILVTVLVATAVVVGASPPPTVHAAPAEQLIPNAGPLGPITVLGDSVLLGSLITSPTLAEHLSARGWGPVRMRAGEGYGTGSWGSNPLQKATYWIDKWRSEGWDPPNVVINLGANDSGMCGANVTCAYNAIMLLLNKIGPGHRVWWPKVTRLYTHSNEQRTWNEALDRVVSERSDVFTWDWPAVMRSGGFPSSDGTHLSASGYRLRSQVMAHEITADLAQGRRVGVDATLATPVATPSTFQPLTPERVLDTRDLGPPVPGASSVELDLDDFVPAGTTAVAVNLTSDRSEEPGFLTGYPCDRPVPNTSNVNHGAGFARGAMAVVPLSTDGRLCVFTRATGHVIVDLQGAFVATSDGSKLTPLDPPQRLADTRQTGRATVVRVAGPAGAEAVAVNLTATGASEPGWLKAYPCDATAPVVSNVNYYPDESVASSAFVPLSDQGEFCVESLNSVDVVVDLTGWFGANGLRFVPTAPTRMLDTRDATGGWSPLQGSGQTFEIGVAPPGAQAVTGTLTIVSPMRPGWLQAYPCNAPSSTSSVNAMAGGVLANSTTVGTTGGRLCILARSATHTLFDVTGWWID